jgi:hypothetical protein
MKQGSTLKYGVSGVSEVPHTRPIREAEGEVDGERSVTSRLVNALQTWCLILCVRGIAS